MVGWGEIRDGERVQEPQGTEGMDDGGVVFLPPFCQAWGKGGG